MKDFFYRNKYIIGFISLMIGGVVFLYCVDELGAIPTFIIASIALFFSHYAFLFSKEKFRLELLEKRWEIYEETLKFCSTVTTYGGLPKHSNDEDRNKQIISALQSAQQSFRGIGLHKARSLFDKDIIEKLNEINKHYAHFVSYQDEFDKERTNRLISVYKLIEDLPDLFKPYVYFGDYKK